ncbi:MAG: energy transducer TonB [Xenococcus sp. (in: cyanobacteria)]
MSLELNPKLNHKQSPETPIISSTQIALLISLGFHLLLYKYGFPNLFFPTKNISGQKTVTTIELSPAEQARLPELDSEFVIPEFNNTPLDGAVPPLALPAYINPEIGDLTDLPAIPVPLLPDFTNLPSYSTDISLPPIGDLSSLPVPPPLEDLDSLLEPPLTPIEELPEEPELLPEEIPVATKTPITPTEKPEEEKPTPEEIAAVRQQKLQGDLQDITNSLQKQDVDTTDEDARENYVAWISRIKEIKPEALLIEGLYPRDACIRRLEGTSVYGVVVDSNNQIVSSQLLKAAAYPVFDQQAIKDLEKYDFGNQTQQTKPYQVTVEYKYNAEICPSLTLPSLRKENQTTTPKPETPPPTPLESEPEVPENVTPTELENPESVSPNDSLRERLQNNPLPDDDTIRERLRNTPLPQEQSSSSSDDSLRDRLQNTPLPNNDDIRERLRNSY